MSIKRAIAKALVDFGIQVSMPAAQEVLVRKARDWTRKVGWDGDEQPTGKDGDR